MWKIKSRGVHELNMKRKKIKIADKMGISKKRSWGHKHDSACLHG